MGIGVAVGGIGVLVGSGVFVGGKGVSVGRMIAGEVGVALAPTVVALGRIIGVPWAAWVCWAIRVCAAAVYMRSGAIVGWTEAPGKLHAVSKNKIPAIKNNGRNLFVNI